MNDKLKIWMKKFEKENKNFVLPKDLIQDLINNTGHLKISKNIPNIFNNFLKEKSYFIQKKYLTGNTSQKEKIFENHFFEFYFLIL